MTEHAHHPAANAPVRSHEPIHPQFMPEASAPYIKEAAQPKPMPALELAAEVMAGLNDLLLTIRSIKQLLG